MNNHLKKRIEWSISLPNYQRRKDGKQKKKKNSTNAKEEKRGEEQKGAEQTEDKVGTKVVRTNPHRSAIAKQERQRSLSPEVKRFY